MNSEFDSRVSVRPSNILHLISHLGPANFKEKKRLLDQDKERLEERRMFEVEDEESLTGQEQEI